MERQKVDYDEVISRGFKRKDQSDKIFYNQNGYEWFIVTKKLTKTIYIDWDCETHYLTLLRTDKEQGAILGRIFLTGDLEELDRIIRFFTGNEPDQEIDILSA
jgi:hypothetical protein